MPMAQSSKLTVGIEGRYVTLTVRTEESRVSHYLTEDDVAALSAIFHHDTEWIPCDWPDEAQGYWTAIGFDDNKAYNYNTVADVLEQAGKHDAAEEFRNKLEDQDRPEHPRHGRTVGCDVPVPSRNELVSLQLKAKDANKLRLGRRPKRAFAGGPDTLK